MRILLDNALRVAPANSRVELAAWSGPATARITVCDQGPGVAEREREQIFERFTRGSSTAGTSGFGLGLAIGRELAARMDGTLELEEGQETSMSPGARFTLTLPSAHIATRAA